MLRGMVGIVSRGIACLGALLLSLWLLANCHFIGGIILLIVFLALLYI